MTGEFPAQRASNAENASIWWRHHDAQTVLNENIQNSIEISLFHWSLFLMVQLTIFQHRQQANTWVNGGRVYWRIYASSGFDELKPTNATQIKILNMLMPYLIRLSSPITLESAHLWATHRKNYRQVSSIKRIASKNLLPVSSRSCLCPIRWSLVLSREWRCGWGSTDGWCSNYIWVIKKCIAY